MDMGELAIIIGLIVIAAVVATVVNDKIDSTGDISPGSAWNPTENPGIYTGADLLKDLLGWLVLGAIIVAGIWLSSGRDICDGGV